MSCFVNTHISFFVLPASPIQSRSPGFPVPVTGDTFTRPGSGIICPGFQMCMHTIDDRVRKVT